MFLHCRTNAVLEDVDDLARIHFKVRFSRLQFEQYSLLFVFVIVLLIFFCIVVVVVVTSAEYLVEKEKIVSSALPLYSDVVGQFPISLDELQFLNVFFNGEGYLTNVGKRRRGKNEQLLRDDCCEIIALLLTVQVVGYFEPEFVVFAVVGGFPPCCSIGFEYIVGILDKSLAANCTYVYEETENGQNPCTI